MLYELILSKDGETWLVTSNDFPELTSFGDSREQALENGLNAVEEAIAARISDNVDVPLSQNSSKNSVEIPAMTTLKLGLYMSLRNLGITRAELQRRMKVNNRETVDRLFRLDHNSRIENLERAYKAIGVPMRIDIPIPDAA